LKLGLVSREHEKYINLPVATRYLVSSSPDFLGGIIDGITLFSPFWQDLEDVIEFGHPATRRNNKSGGDFWEQVYSTPENIRRLLNIMHDESWKPSELLEACFEWSYRNHLVELGAGSGRNAITILEKNEHLTATLVDLPRVVPYTAEFVGRSSVSNRVDITAGDFFDRTTLPKNGDVYLLSWILHNWSDVQAMEILHNVYAIMPVGAELLISELFLPQVGTEPDSTAESSLNMLLYFGGRERTTDEYVGFVTKAGFRSIETLDPNAGKGLVYALK